MCTNYDETRQYGKEQLKSFQSTSSDTNVIVPIYILYIILQTVQLIIKLLFPYKNILIYVMFN